LPDSRTLDGDACIVPVAIAMAARPAEPTSRSDCARQSFRQGRKPRTRVLAQRREAQNRGHGAVQQMIEVEPVSIAAAGDEPIRSLVDLRQRHPVGARVGGQIRLRRAALRIFEQNRRTPPLRQYCDGKESSVSGRHRSRDRNALFVQIGDKRGFRRDIRLTPSAPARQAENQTLAVLGSHLEGVVETPAQQSAFDRARQAIMRCDEISHGVGTRGRIGDCEGWKSHSDRTPCRE
jgi:hypothetical protein